MRWSIGTGTRIFLQWEGNIMGFGELGVDRKLFAHEREMK
jgi:hypothetical protein